jgi:hypothetical protein
MKLSEYHHYDPKGHLLAISHLLGNAKIFASEKSMKLSHVDYSKYGDRAEDAYDEAFHNSVYCDAAYSHLVASSLGTFFESFFFHEFQNLKCEFEHYTPLNKSARWNLPEDHFWNPKKVADEHGKLRNKENFIKGLFQLMEAIEIPISIPTDKYLIIQTLFLYRNYVVHNGFEWRTEKIDEFIKRLKELQISHYFSYATSGESIWIIYLSDEFEQKAINLAFELVNSFENWFWKKMDERFLNNF